MRRTKMARRGLLLASLASLAACAGETSGGGHAAPVPLSQANDSTVNAVCGGFSSCCASKGFAFNASACDANERSYVGSEGFCPAPAVYDAQAAGDCFAELQASYASCSGSLSANSACDRVCVGTLPAGSSCTHVTDCAKPASGSVFCAASGTSGTSLVCIVQPRGKAGDGCISTCTASADGYGLACDPPSVSSGGPQPTGMAGCYSNDGLYCSNVDYTCHPVVAVGSACVTDRGCQTDAYCDPVTSLCKARVATGAACSQNVECVDSAYCTSTQVCANKKTDGASCASYVECIGYCDTTGLCTGNGAPDLNVTADFCANPSGN